MKKRQKEANNERSPLQAIQLWLIIINSCFLSIPIFRDSIYTAERSGTMQTKPTQYRAQEDTHLSYRPYKKIQLSQELQTKVQ